MVIKPLVAGSWLITSASELSSLIISLAAQ